MGTIHRQSSAAPNRSWGYPDLPLTDYRTDASPGITKQVLIGATEGASDFIVRYFTIPPGGKSAFDQHEHQHGVVITQGRGEVLLGTEWHSIAAGDSVFIGTNEIHQLAASAAEPLCFICVIPRWAEAGACAVANS